MAKTREKQIAHHTQRKLLDLNTVQKITSLLGIEYFLLVDKGGNKKISITDLILKLTTELDLAFTTEEEVNILIANSTDVIHPTYETVNKNLNAYPYTLTYIGKNIDTVVYVLGSGLSITKTFSYTGKDLTTTVLSGDTPLGILLTKTLTYTGKDLTGVVYS